MAKRVKNTVIARRAKAELPPLETPVIVGIGASAGGLEAFTQLLQALPANTGMVFVLVQHLEPKHESVLTRLLAKETKMAVLEIQDGVRVEPDHVYVLPANTDVLLEGGILRLVRRKAAAGHHLPIDSFFRSLAEAQGVRSIGVVLSGTASDGTVGLGAIKLEGGFTLAQDPETAKFDGMPRSAIAAGCVDLVLPPDRIAKELVHISHHPFVRLAPIEGVPVIPAEDEDWRRFFRMLRTNSGVDFSRYKQSTIRRRLARRMALHKVEDLKSYLKVLEATPEETDALFQEILIHVTSFFRDPEVFVALREHILPQIFKEKMSGEALRIWVAGCSTGEEAYSIAICAVEYLDQQHASFPIQIFATDISETAIQKARLGKYSTEALAGVSKERLRRYFTAVNGEYQINHDLRDMCVFARHDVTKDPPFSKLDLISCRNVLIYFESALQKKVLGSFHYGLKSTGLLLLGKSESLSAHTDLFTIQDKKNKVFFKNNAVAVPLSVARPQLEAAKLETKPQRPLIGQDLEREADRMVWERYAHAGLVVNQDLQILHFRGDTSPYLRPAPGRATFQLLRMVRDELSLELRAAVQEARKTGRNVRKEGVQLKQDGQVRVVNLEVRPMPVSGERERSFLILFEDSGLRDESTPKPRLSVRKRGQVRDEELLSAKAELAKAREYVQAVLRDQDATNEELTTANEEALSSMEELQSTNEELETAKEELQSTNEELITLNEQLQNRNTELGRLTDDLTNVLNGVNIPILILNKDRRIRRFTPPAEKLLRLLPGDVGRPIGDLRIGISIPDMETLITTVVEKALEVRREVQGDEDRRWYMLSIRPFRTSGGKVDGVLMAFVDVDQLKREQDSLRRERDINSSILEAAKDLLVMVVDAKGRIVHLNRVAERVTGYALKEVRGKAYTCLLVPEERPGSLDIITNVLKGESIRREGHILTKDGRRVTISGSMGAATTDRDVQYVIATSIDITEMREIEGRAADTDATMRALLENAAQAILAIDQRGEIVLANAAAEAMYGYDRSELIGQPLSRLVPATAVARHAVHVSRWFREPMRRPMGKGGELSGLRKNGTAFSVEVSLSSVETRDGILGVAFISDISERRKNELSLQTYHTQLQQLTANLISSQEGGNRELARELHDVFSQELAAASMEVSALLASADQGGPFAERLKSVGNRIARLAEDIHGTSRRLHPAILDDLGLPTALREECRSFQQQVGIAADFAEQNLPEILPKDVALCLYRVAQESLRNIRKHSQATHVHVQLAGTPSAGPPDGILLRVVDEGNGFELEQVLKKGGLGIISMEERVRLLGGQLTIHSQPVLGTTVMASVPLKS